MALSLLIAGAGVATITGIVMSRPAFRQSPETVVIRQPGRRLLGKPENGQSAAREDVQYALLSAAAYGAIRKDKPDTVKPCVDASAALADSGWVMWPDFPSKNLQSAMDQVHLRAQVWQNAEQKLVVVAFGGTEFASWKDWRSNLRWFNPFRNDEYTLTAGAFSEAFRDEFQAKKAQARWDFLDGYSVYATGHSLGGGLAEQFAYALPVNADGTPRVTRVYAFDPSPVTGFLSVRKSIRDENTRDLRIDRIYQRGEVLAMLRSLTSVLHKPSAKNPEVRQLRYNLFGNDRYGVSNVIANHSIPQLACGLQDLAAGRMPTNHQ